MSAYTYTHAYTRAEVLVNQVDVLFSEAGIDEDRRQKVCAGVNERWLEAVGLYLVRDDKRVYEIEARISWAAHTENAELSFSTDLPGWEGKGSPEAVILGRRFAKVVKAEKLTPHYWVRFTKTIRDDPARHEVLCEEVGVLFGSHVADWKKTPETRSLPLQDLREVGFSERNAL